MDLFLKSECGNAPQVPTMTSGFRGFIQSSKQSQSQPWFVMSWIFRVLIQSMASAVPRWNNCAVCDCSSHSLWMLQQWTCRAAQIWEELLVRKRALEFITSLLVSRSWLVSLLFWVIATHGEQLYPLQFVLKGSPVLCPAQDWLGLQSKEPVCALTRRSCNSCCAVRSARTGFISLNPGVLVCLGCSYCCLSWSVWTSWRRSHWFQVSLNHDGSCTTKGI